jgi:hypothetical protein
MLRNIDLIPISGLQNPNSYQEARGRILCSFVQQPHIIRATGALFPMPPLALPSQHSYACVPWPLITFFFFAPRAARATWKSLMPIPFASCTATDLYDRRTLVSLLILLQIQFIRSWRYVRLCLLKNWQSCQVFNI